MRQRTFLSLFFVLALALVSTQEAMALNETTVTGDTTINWFPITMSIAGDNFDNGYLNLSLTTGQTLHKEMGLEYCRLWIPRRAEFWKTGTDIDFNTTEVYINNSLLHNCTPFIVIGGHNNGNTGWNIISWIQNDTLGNTSQLIWKSQIINLSTFPNMTQFANYTITLLRHLNKTYNISTWRFELLNEPYNMYGANHVAYNYTYWYSNVSTNVSAVFPSIRLGGNPGDTGIQGFIQYNIGVLNFTDWHLYGAGTAGVADNTVMNRIETMEDTRGALCYNKSVQYLNKADMECIIGEYNWNSASTIDARRNSKMAAAYIAGFLIHTYNNTNASWGSNNVGTMNMINITFFYDGIEKVNSDAYGYITVNDDGTLVPNYQYYFLKDMKLFVPKGAIAHQILANDSWNINGLLFSNPSTPFNYTLMLVNKRNETNIVNLTLTLPANSVIKKMVNMTSGESITPSGTMTNMITLGAFDILFLSFTSSNVWDGSTNEGCVSFEPLGSCPETAFPLRPSVSYTNTIREDVSFYYFDYNGTDENNTFAINKIYSNNTVCSPFYVNASNNNNKSMVYGSYGLLINKLSTFAGHQLTIDWVNESGVEQFNTDVQNNLINCNITSNYISGSSVTFNFWYILKNNGGTGSVYGINKNLNVTFNITIKGKTLFVEETSDSRWIRTYLWNRLETDNLIPISVFASENHTVQTANAPYNTGVNTFLVINKTYFFTIQPVLDKSNFSKFRSTFNNHLNVNSSTVTINAGTYYENKTNQEFNTYHEVIAISLSQNAEDMFVNSANEQSSFRSSIKNKYYVEYWAGCYLTGCLQNETARLLNYGFDPTKMSILMLDYGEPNPDNSNFSNGGTRELYLSLDQNLSSQGIQIGYYSSPGDLYPASPFYNNTEYNVTNLSNCMLLNDSRTLNGYNHGYWGQSCVMKTEKRPDVYYWNYNNISNDGGASLYYLDTVGANNIVNIDYDSNSYQNGSMRKVIPATKLLTDFLHSNDKYVVTENHYGLWTAGIVDVGEGTKDCCQNSYTMGSIPEWEEAIMGSDQILIQPYLRRYMKNWNNSNSLDYSVYGDANERYFDKWIVQSIVDGFMLHIDNFQSQGHDIPDNLTIKTYYSQKYIDELIMAATIENISRVASNSSFSDLSTAILDNQDFYNFRIYKKYSNGLHIYANLNNTEPLTSSWWNLSINGALRSIPPNGLYAYIENDSSFSMFFNADNTSTYVITEDYVYLYPKNDMTITFSIPLGLYNRTIFYGDDSTNGRRSTEVIYTDSITTKNAEILYPLWVAEEGVPLNIYHANFTMNLYDSNLSSTGFCLASGAQVALFQSMISIG